MMNEMYKMFLDNVPCPIWIKSADKSIIYVNRAYEKMHDVKSKDILGKNNEFIYDIQTAVTYDQNAQQVLETKTTMVFEGEMYGTHKCCHIFPFLDNNENVIAYTGLIVDINERRERELELQKQSNLLQTIIDSIPDVIFYKDKESRYIGYNKQFKDFYERKGIHDLLGKTDLDVNDNRELAQSFMAKDKFLMKNRETEYTEARFVAPDGSAQIMECVKVPVIDEEGEVWGIVGVSRDVTRNKVLEDKLRNLSYTDGLTGLFNRSKFEDRITELNNPKYLPLGLIMGDVNGLKLINDTMGHLEGDKLLKDTARVLKNACGEKADIFRWGGDEFVILLPNTNEAECESVVRIISEQCKSYKSDFMQLSISLGISVSDALNSDIDKMIKEAEDKVYRQKLLAEKSVRSNIISLLQKSLQEKNMETEQHTARLVEHAQRVGKELGLKQFQLDELVLVTKLHDIGKIGISEEILLKPGRLTDEEFEIMKTHTEKGYRIVQATGGLSNVATGVLTHHERWDGKGYPLKLKGEEIPLNARVVCVVDAFDAMTSNRVYQKAIPQEEAIAELRRCAGTQFDPTIVEVFITKVLKCG